MTTKRRRSRCSAPASKKAGTKRIRSRRKPLEPNRYPIDSASVSIPECQCLDCRMVRLRMLWQSLVLKGVAVPVLRDSNAGRRSGAQQANAPSAARNGTGEVSQSPPQPTAAMSAEGNGTVGSPEEEGKRFGPGLPTGEYLGWDKAKPGSDVTICTLTVETPEGSYHYHYKLKHPIFVKNL